MEYNEEFLNQFVIYGKMTLEFAMGVLTEFGHQPILSEVIEFVDRQEENFPSVDVRLISKHATRTGVPGSNIKIAVTKYVGELRSKYEFYPPDDLFPAVPFYHDDPFEVDEEEENYQEEDEEEDEDGIHIEPPEEEDPR